MLRLVMATAAAATSILVAAALLGLGAAREVPGATVAAAICLVVAVVSVVDAIQVRRRIRRGDLG